MSGDGDKQQGDSKSRSIPTPVLEYYRNYSLNKQLSKYFTGTSSVSYIPEIVQSNDEEDDFQSVKDTEEPPNPSPTSSIASNRKLEWDNGADIGYNNCSKARTLSKSVSLPILEHKSDNNRSSTTTTTSASLPIVIIDEQNTTTSTNSSGQKSNILLDLKRKIGTPDAESTPKDITTKTSRILKRNVRLCLTKPGIVDCIDGGGGADMKIDKDVQTSPVIRANLSKMVQTGDSLKKNTTINESNQSVIVINCNNNSDKQSTNTDSLKTTSEIAATSNCNSFEYLSGDHLENKSNNSNKTDTTSNISELLQKNQSNYLIKDIECSIELLKRLVKSKRYDATTKERYIKKIVEKILNSKYIDDSRSNSTSSSNRNHNEAVSQQKLEDNLPWYPALSIKTFSNEYLPKLTGDAKKRSIFTTNLQEKPINSTSSSSSSNQSWKDNQTLSEQLLESCKGQGDSLINYATKERQYQLQWINDEIGYLGKLKQLLENNNKLDNNQKTTTVYMMTGNSNKYRHNHVTEAELKKSGSSSSSRNNQQSNGHVKTQKSREPSLVGHGVYQTSTFPRSQQFSVEIPLDEQKQILNERICNIVKQFEKICENSGKSTNNSSSNSNNRQCLCENKSIQVDGCDCQDMKHQKSTQIDPIVSHNDDYDKDCRCASAAVQTEDLTKTKSINASSSSSSSSLSSSYQSLKWCTCCRGKFDKLYTTKKRIPTIPLCRPCYYQLLKCPQQSQFYNDPSYNCKCYTRIKTNTLNEIKKTVNELNDLEDYCTCLNNEDDDDKYCYYCRCKLKKATHNRKGVAYLLTFENTAISKQKKKKPRRPLEEIKVKIPSIRPNKRITSSTTVKYNLQDYLIKNRPKFVQFAELRRQAVINTKLEREQNQDEKKLLFLQNNPTQQLIQQRYEQRLFSVKEMKQNTKKHYRKLPEVQQKLVVQKEKQIRQANRLITDVFNRKLKENVLRGKLDFPSDLYVVNL